MTAPAVAPAFHMIATYKKGHELEGMKIELGHQCGCGRWFMCQVISRQWLNTLTAERRAAFLGACEIEDIQVGAKQAKVVWFPGRCYSCERRKIDADALNS